MCFLFLSIPFVFYIIMVPVSKVFLGFSYILWKRNLDNREIEINNNHSLRYLPFRLDSTEFTGLPDDHKVEELLRIERERDQRDRKRQI